MRTDVDELVDDYLRQLEEALRDAPRGRREELLEEIADHIAAARSEMAAADEAAMRTLLDRLGDPSEIADEARTRLDVANRPPARLEIAALVFLLAGSVALSVVGWLIGVTLVWMSGVWTARDKLIATLVPPGGLATALLMALMPFGSPVACSGGVTAAGRVWEHCTGGPSQLTQTLTTIAFVLVVVTSFTTPAYLAWRVRQRRPATPAGARELDLTPA
jgi:uncharacterized membrane protein